MIFFRLGIHILRFNMNTLITFNNKINFNENRSYSQQDLNEAFAFMKFFQEKEFLEYEKMKAVESETKREYNNDFLEEKSLTFEDIFTELDDKGNISLYAKLDNNKKEYLFEYDMNRNQDIMISYEKNEINVSFYNTEKEGNLKCIISYSKYLYPSKKDIFNIKKIIESMLYDIEEYSSFYFKYLIDKQINEIDRDLAEGLNDDIDMAEEIDEKEAEFQEYIERMANSSNSEEDEDDGGLWDIQRYKMR